MTTPSMLTAANGENDLFGHQGCTAARAARWPSKENQQKLIKQFILCVHGKHRKIIPKKGRAFFPTNQDSANILGMPDFHFENFRLILVPDFQIPTFTDFQSCTFQISRHRRRCWTNSPKAAKAPRNRVRRKEPLLRFMSRMQHETCQNHVHSG